MTINKLLLTFVAVGFSLSLYAQNDVSDCIALAKDEKYEEALVCLNKYINKNPTDFNARTIRGICYEGIEDYKKALSDLTDVLKNYDESIFLSKDVLFAKRGRIYESADRYDDALSDYTAALKINPENIDILFDRANLYCALKNYPAADADFKQILKIDKDNTNAAVGLASNMIARGQIEEAIKELDRLEKIDYSNPTIYEYRAKAYMKKEDYRKAVDDVINWMYYDEIYRLNIIVLSHCAEYEFIYTIAKVSKQIVTDKDNELDWLYLRASLYQEHEMYREAIADYNRIENLLSSPVVFLYESRGECYTETGEYDKAIAEFNKGLELQENKKLYLYKADAERLKGDYESSIADFTKVTELDPMNDFAYYRRGWVKEFMKDFQGALRDYSTAIEIDKDYAYTYMNRGRLYQKELNKPQLAEKDFLTVLKLDNEVKKSGNCRQYALFHLGRTDEAVAYMDSILNEYPSSGNFYDAACLYSLMNRPAKAVAYLRTAFEKGYRNFIHIKQDNDLDNIRNTPEFIELIKEWSNKKKPDITESQTPQQRVDTKKYVVKTKPLRSGVYEIPCTVNDLPLKFIFDTGAANITISSLDAAFMLKNNYLTEYDFKSKQNYRTASGDIAEGTKIRLRKVKIGDLELSNIEASVIHKQTAPLLFGQSALGKFVNITIDNAKNEIVFEY
jgi:clan AA aspartic protease (TIGR02281 family)